MPSVCFHPLEVNLAACAEHGGSASPMVRDDVPGTVQAAGQPEPLVLTATFTSCSTPNCGKWACTDGFCRDCHEQAEIVGTPHAEATTDRLPIEAPHVDPKAESPTTVVPQCVCAQLRAAKLEWEGWPQVEKDECLLCLPADRMKLLSAERSNEGGDPDNGLVWHDSRSIYECPCGAQYTERQHMKGAAGPMCIGIRCGAWRGIDSVRLVTPTERVQACSAWNSR